MSSSESDLFQKKLDAVWQLNLEGYTESAEILAEAERRYQITMSEDELEAVFDKLMDLVDEVDADDS